MRRVASCQNLAVSVTKEAVGRHTIGILMLPVRVGSEVEVQWLVGRTQRWCAGYVKEVDDGHHLVVYDDGDQQWHALADELADGTARLLNASGLHGRAPFVPWPATEDEAVARRWSGFAITSSRGKFQLYTRQGMLGLGLRQAPTAKALAAPPSRGGEAALLMWFEGTVFDGHDAVARAAEFMRADAHKAAPEVVEVSTTRALAPLRRAAQLAECAADAVDANAELCMLSREGHGLWPALCQTRAIAPGEALRWVYNDDAANPMATLVRAWRRGACARREATVPRKEQAAVAQRERLAALQRKPNGTFKKGRS